MILLVEGRRLRGLCDEARERVVTGPDGETEVIVVRSPRISGIVEAWRLNEGRLTQVAGSPATASTRWPPTWPQRPMRMAA